jgi:hypothetical protein
MSGGLTELVAIGAQDTHIVGSPEVSFFQSSFKRHSNFSSVIQREVIQGTPQNNGYSTIRFERKGDLLSYVYLVAKNISDVTVAPAWNTIINNVELYIGGQLIDSQDYDFSTNVHTEVMASALSKSIYGPGPSYNDNTNYFYPLKFWFCENWQSSLPLIALQYHDVEIRIYWGSNITTDSTSSLEAWSRYIYLDESERNMISERRMDMLLHQVQKIPAPYDTQVDLSFNHPVKFIASRAAGFAVDKKTILQLNGTDVGEKKQSVPHYTAVSSYHHQSQAGVVSADSPKGYGSVTLMIPFCLDASKLQPTGTCNFSRIDSSRIINDSSIESAIYAVNYNILRVQSGMAGLLYAN